MLKIALSKSQIRAVLRFAAKNDIRYYLNGINVECHRTVAYLTATNGHFLGICRVERDSEDCGTGSFILPREVLEKIKPTGKWAADLVTVTVDGDRFTIADAIAGTETRGAVVEGTFPDWRRVIPDKVSGESAQYSAEYLALMAKAAGDLGYKGGGNGYTIGQNGQASAIVEFTTSPHFLAVIMPVRDEAPEMPHHWVREDSANLGRVFDVEEAWDEAIAENDARDMNDGAGPIAYVSPEIAAAFNMAGIPNVRIAD